MLKEFFTVTSEVFDTNITIFYVFAKNSNGEEKLILVILVILKDMDEH